MKRGRCADISQADKNGDKDEDSKSTGLWAGCHSIQKTHTKRGTSAAVGLKDSGEE
jgi:hypothetical protein